VRQPAVRPGGRLPYLLRHRRTLLVSVLFAVTWAVAVAAVPVTSSHGIDHSLPGMVGRSVLLGIARLRAVEWFQSLQSSDVIKPDELEAGEPPQGIHVGRRHALLVRTAWPRKA
jgi:hypothetical protein